jgi:hypothetical protein
MTFSLPSQPHNSTQLLLQPVEQPTKPFTRKRPMSKIVFSIQYAGLTLPVIQNDKGQDVTPLKPIADLFGLDWETQRKKVTNGDFYPAFFGTCTGLMPGAGSQNREQTCIRLDRVAAYLMGINPERVTANGNDSGGEYLTEKITEWADALHDYEEIGVAVNLNHIKTQEALRRQRTSFAQMISVRNKTANQADRAALACVVRSMAAELGVPYQAEITDPS